MILPPPRLLFSFSVVQFYFNLIVSDRYRVWLSVVKFQSALTPAWDPQKTGEICRSYLNVWDGQLWAPTNCNDFYW